MLRFASEEEALQHLADITGKKIKIANENNKYILDITYQTTTPESVEEGDFADSGFEAEDLEFDSLYEIIGYMLSKGAAEPSNSTYFHPNTWYSTTDPETDYTTGEETQYSFHVKGVTEEEGKIIFNSIKSGKNLVEEEDF